MKVINYIIFRVIIIKVNKLTFKVIDQYYMYA